MPSISQILLYTQAYSCQTNSESSPNMPTALIFGGSGKVARHLTSILVSHSYLVHSIIRSTPQIPSLTSLGAQPIVQSIETASVAELTDTIRSAKPDVIVWSAGAGAGDPARTDLVDRQGATRSFDAAAAAGVKRFLMVSAVDTRDLQKSQPSWYNEDDKARSDRSHEAIGKYYDAKLAADKDLVTGNAKRGLEYTIVRPGGLNMEPATGKCAAGKVHITESISREDVAQIIFECIQDDGTKGLAFDCVGGRTKIADAVAGVAKDRVDTFEGLY